MAIKVSGTRSQSPGGSYSISSPSGTINLEATNTNIAGNTQIAGYAGVVGFLEVGSYSTLTGQVTILSTITSTSTNSGALIVDGGVGIRDNINIYNSATIGYTLFVGSSTYIGSSATIIGGLTVGTTSTETFANIYGPTQIYNSATITGTIYVVGNSSTVIIKPNADNVGNPFGVVYTNTNVYDTFADRITGAVYVAGGVGIEKDLNVGGYIYGRIANATTSVNVVVTATNDNTVFYPMFAQFNTGSTGSSFTANYVDEISSGTTTATGGLTYVPFTGLLTSDQMAVAADYNSSSTTTGAFTVAGGAGIAKDLHIGGNIFPASDSVQQIGAVGEAWADAYINNLLTTQFIGNTTTNITMNANNGNGLVDIYGSIRVRGDKPVGTFPVVTNILYVTMDGDDTNDGRAMDASRACRTIGGAMKSPYYQPGTQIRVSAGHYFENNPLPMKPYTSVMGSDIRTTEIEPINKTQDLFHVNSGCYLAFMQFCQGRSGLLPGNYYANGYNRGAYATAFPPQTGNNRIDLFHSPYIQNCTNLSGPWLKDGTLFQPDGTVQIPLALGTSTWSANTTSLIVTLDTNISSGVIKQGMSITQGHQNPGFFNARTLLLANSAFMQAQVVSYIDETFNSGNFVYNQATCARDTGLIVDSIAMDMLYDSNSESTFAGLQYWNQDIGYTGLIESELAATLDAINNINGLLDTISLAVDPSSNSTNIIDNLFYVISGIVGSGNPATFNNVGVTSTISPNGLPTNNTTTIAVYNAIIAASPTIAADVVDYINTTYPALAYNTATCYRDVGYIIQSVAFDLLHGGNRQSVKAATYYYAYDSTSTAVSNQIPQVDAAYYYLKSIIPNIITGVKLPTQYSTSVQIITGFNPGTSHEVVTLQAKIDEIINIVTNGPNVAGPKVPINLTQDGNIETLNAYIILEQNRQFIIDEVIAYINSQFNTFSFNQELCYRDVGILIENVSYDATFGGNEKSVEAGLSYWNGTSSVLPGQQVQCIAGIKYLNKLCQKVILNELCPVLPAVPNSGIAITPQVINTVLTGGEITGPSIASLFETITNVIENGPSVSPTSYISAGQDAAFISAEVLLQLNRGFIQEDTTNWINNTFVQFPFNKIKCQRDIGVIINSVIGDVLFPTERHSQSTFAGLQYYNQSTSTQTIIPNEINQTIDAFTYLRDLSAKIVQNITPDIDLVPRYQNTVTQVTTLESATQSEATTITTLYDNVLTILNGYTTGWTDNLKFGFTKSNFLSVQNAYALLEANKSYMQAEVVAYINAVNPGFSTTYNQDLCKRDIGSLTDCVAFDLLYGGNKQSIQAGLCYYGFIGTSTNIVNETTQTVAAFNYLSNITGLVIKNVPVIGYSSATQITTLPPIIDTTATVSLFTSAYSTITNIIANGPSVAVDVSAISLIENTATDISRAIAIIEANMEYLTTETLAFIQTTYNSTNYSYNVSNCTRDTGLIVDGIAQDMLYQCTSDSNFSGLQYWTQTGLTGQILYEQSTTTAAISYVRDQVVSSLTDSESIISVITLFDDILNIINNGVTGITNRFISNGLPSTTATIVSSYETMIGLLSTLPAQTISWINTNNPGFTYNTSTCARDVGYIIQSVAYDLLTGGNKQSLKSGAYYYGYSSTSSQVYTELPEVNSAYAFLADRIRYVVLGESIPQLFQTTVAQITDLPTATNNEVEILQNNLGIILNIINNGPSVAEPKVPMSLIESNNENILNAYNLLKANNSFLQAEIVAFINKTYTGGATFIYDEAKSFRDTGLLVDAVSQDVLLGGNQKSVEAGLSYWNRGYNYLIETGCLEECVLAINHARDMALSIIANTAVIPQQQTETNQIINSFYQYGSNYMPQEAIRRNFDIITDIIQRGPVYAPQVYPGSGLSNTTGLNALDVQIAPTVTSVSQISGNTYLVGMSTATVGFANNATLYFGNSSIFPLQDYQVEALALQYTGKTNTWDMRKVDPIGGMGGSLVDGAVISDRSPIQSFVYDAFTQLTQGGHGVKVTNNGYAQLVSVFTIFSSVGVQVDNGGIASIVNSNANFGDICLLAKGYGPRKFSGTVYNPPNNAYPFSPGPTGLNQYYPTGFWPNNGQVEIFVSDPTNRPHISLVMEVIPPDNYINYTGTVVPYRNSQGLPGFLNAQPSTGTITSGTITITGIDVSNIAIGNSVYIEDQFSYQYDNFPYIHDEFGRPLALDGSIATTSSQYQPNPNYLKYYTQTGTVITDVNYQSITLNYAIPITSGYSNNPNYFTIYCCGNAYYTVLSSTVANNPYVTGTNILSTNNINITVDQVQAHVDSIEYLNELVDNIVGNTPVRSLQTGTATSTQVFLPTVIGGASAIPFIDQRFGNITTILQATNSTFTATANAQVITQTGTIPAGSGSAVSLITANTKFLQDEITAFVNTLASTSTFVYDETLCRRDLGYIFSGNYYDVALGTNYNAVTSGLAYTRGVSSVVTATELVQTITALDYAQKQIDIAMSTNSIAVKRNNKSLNEIKNILANGTAVASVINFPAPSTALQTTVNAVNQITANKSFLQAEVVAWVNNYFDIVFNQSTCARDVGYIIDAICYDVMYGGNSASIICANAYFDNAGNILIGASEYSATAGSYNHLSMVIQSLVLGNPVIPSSGNLLFPIYNLAYGSSTENTIINTNLQIIETAISSQVAPGYASSVYPSTAWVDSGIMTADNDFLNQQATIIDTTISYIDETFGISKFTYNEATCARDTGLIVDALAQDLLFSTSSQSTFAGIQYWNQGGYVGAIASQLTTTTNTINYISSLAQQVVQNDPSGVRYQSTVTQIHTVLPAATIDEANTIANDFSVITTILTNGTTGTTDLIVPNGLIANTDANVQNAFNLLQANKSYLQAEAIAYITANATPGFVYSTSTCYRDIGYMVDSVSVDLLYGGNRQAIQSGVYYWNYNSSSSAIPGEIPQTTAAYAHIRDIVPYIITGIDVPTLYQTNIPQVTNLTPGTNSEVSIVQSEVDIITNIISNGPNGIVKTPLGVEASANPNVINAALILEANRAFIQAEVIAYVNANSAGVISLTLTQQLKCKRDVGLMLQDIIYDLETGGNYNSVQAGLSYWSRDGTYHLVNILENVTNSALFPDGATVNFYQRSYISASGYVFEYVGAGTNYGALPQFGIADPVQSKETVQVSNGAVYFTSTDQNGDFRIGPNLVISQATGVISGRTFTKSLFANLTPFILAIEGGGVF